MGSRKKPYIPKSFESVNGKTLSANLYATMLQHPAVVSLSAGAFRLYVYMKLQYYGAKNIPDHPQSDFYFNHAMACKVYGIYTNRKQFRNDRDQLIEHGLIEVVEKYRNEKTIYRFSNKWQEWTKPS